MGQESYDEPPTHFELRTQSKIFIILKERFGAQA